MKTVTAIFEDDYGCEDRADDAPLTVLVELTDENGNKSVVRAEDGYLRINGIGIGSAWKKS